VEYEDLIKIEGMWSLEPEIQPEYLKFVNEVEIFPGDKVLIIYVRLKIGCLI